MPEIGEQVHWNSYRAQTSRSPGAGGVPPRTSTHAPDAARRSERARSRPGSRPTVRQKRDAHMHRYTDLTRPVAVHQCTGEPARSLCVDGCCREPGPQVPSLAVRATRMSRSVTLICTIWGAWAAGSRRQAAVGKHGQAKHGRIKHQSCDPAMLCSDSPRKEEYTLPYVPQTTGIDRSRGSWVRRGQSAPRISKGGRRSAGRAPPSAPVRCAPATEGVDEADGRLEWSAGPWPGTGESSWRGLSCVMREPTKSHTPGVECGCPLAIAAGSWRGTHHRQTQDSQEPGSQGPAVKT